MKTEIPITEHPKLPEGVPLVANFNDDRNRLSYYFPLLREIDGVRTPVTEFFAVDGHLETFPEIEYREITRFMQDIGTTNAFVRGDFSSGKYDGNEGSKIESQDAVDIENVVLEMFRQLALSGRHLGRRIAVREWIPHDAEVRFFVRDGQVVYAGTLDDVPDAEFPDLQAELVAEAFDTFAWSVDFIRNEFSGKWYCIDMGLDGLYHDGEGWISISEHLSEEHSLERYFEAMPEPQRFRHRR